MHDIMNNQKTSLEYLNINSVLPIEELNIDEFVSFFNKQRGSFEFHAHEYGTISLKKFFTKRFCRAEDQSGIMGRTIVIDNNEVLYLRPKYG
uniref:DUF2835 family protein n=1 Tax=Panagrellus redivivus TaxID=6233 RepID=A0A7E5A1B3_PANRE